MVSVRRVPSASPLFSIAVMTVMCPSAIQFRIICMYNMRLMYICDLVAVPGANYPVVGGISFWSVGRSFCNSFCNCFEVRVTVIK